MIHVVVLIHFTPEYSRRLDSKLKMTFNRKNNVRIVSLVVDLVDNVYLYLSEGAMVQKLTFQDIEFIIKGP